jgi:hypothetical protein
MGKLRAPDVDWPAEARRLSDLLVGLLNLSVAVPVRGKGAIRALAKTHADQEPGGGISDATREGLVQILTKVAIRLVYGLMIVQGGQLKVPEARKALSMLIAGPFDKKEVAQRKLEEVAKVQFGPEDRLAVEVIGELWQLSIFGVVTSEQARLLPLKVAALAGKSTSEIAKIKGSKRRTGRKSELELAKKNARSLNPFATYKELLVKLEGEGIVIKWDADQIDWMDELGLPHITRTQTFQNWRTSKRE